MYFGGKLSDAAFFSRFSNCLELLLPSCIVLATYWLLYCSDFFAARQNITSSLYRKSCVSFKQKADSFQGSKYTLKCDSLGWCFLAFLQFAKDMLEVFTNLAKFRVNSNKRTKDDLLHESRFFEVQMNFLVETVCLLATASWHQSSITKSFFYLINSGCQIFLKKAKKNCCNLFLN